MRSLLNATPAYRLGRHQQHRPRSQLRLISFARTALRDKLWPSSRPDHPLIRPQKKATFTVRCLVKVH